jgi:hypothetical protein
LFGCAEFASRLNLLGDPSKHVRKFCTIAKGGFALAQGVRKKLKTVRRVRKSTGAFALAERRKIQAEEDEALLASVDFDPNGLVVFTPEQQAASERMLHRAIVVEHAADLRRERRRVARKKTAPPKV